MKRRLDHHTLPTVGSTVEGMHGDVQLDCGEIFSCSQRCGGFSATRGRTPTLAGLYIRRILLTDTLVVVAAVALAQWVSFGGPGSLVDYAL